MPEIELETADLKEKLEAILDETEGSNPQWLRYLSLATALVAVLAAVASLLSGSRSNEAILQKNEALLVQTRASDQWSYFQAKGVKGALAASQAEVLAEANPALAAHLRKEAERYKGEQADIQTAAQELERKVEEYNRRSTADLEEHHQLALAVTLFQIAIAMGAIAALTRRQFLLWTGLVATLTAVGFLLRGLLM